mmetsp:Transcript_48899/g.95588  ORF Transcript_48899/g.95588 Transcript_48899/m.95588 type:complete len:537 (-) Transcript_48899:228-1838(-)
MGWIQSLFEKKFKKMFSSLCNAYCYSTAAWYGGGTPAPPTSAAGHGHGRLVGMVDKLAPKLGRPVRLVDGGTVVSPSIFLVGGQDRGDFGRVHPPSPLVSVWRVPSAVRTRPHPPPADADVVVALTVYFRGLGAAVGHGEVADLDVSDDSAVCPRETCDDSAEHPHGVEHFTPAPVRLDHVLVVVVTAFVRRVVVTRIIVPSVSSLVVLHPLRTVPDYEHREPAEQREDDERQLPRAAARPHSRIPLRIKVLERGSHIRISVSFLIGNIPIPWIGWGGEGRGAAAAPFSQAPPARPPPTHLVLIHGKGDGHPASSERDGLHVRALVVVIPGKGRGARGGPGRLVGVRGAPPHVPRGLRDGGPAVAPRGPVGVVPVARSAAPGRRPSRGKTRMVARRVYRSGRVVVAVGTRRRAVVRHLCGRSAEPAPPRGSEGRARSHRARGGGVRFRQRGSRRGGGVGGGIREGQRRRRRGRPGGQEVTGGAAGGRRVTTGRTARDSGAEHSLHARGNAVYPRPVAFVSEAGDAGHGIIGGARAR